jgi:acetyltransferase-like isoleucine patch superfamily enzyme
MNDINSSQTKIKLHRRTAYTTALLGSIPLEIGQKLRRLVYPFLFRKFGREVNIEPNVQFIYSQSIEIGTSSAICSDSLVNCWHGGEFILKDFSKIDKGAHIQTIGATIIVGKRVYIGPYVCMAGPGNISIGDDCMIASHTGIFANNHAFADPNLPINQQGVSAEGIVIEEDCWIGSGVKILDGVTIGKGSVIGAGAVITKDVPPYSIAVGVPAKVISKRDANRPKQEAIVQTIS